MIETVIGVGTDNDEELLSDVHDVFLFLATFRSYVGYFFNNNTLFPNGWTPNNMKKYT